MPDSPHPLPPDSGELSRADLELYHDLFEHAPAGYLILDENGRIRQANRAAAQLCSHSPDELKDQPFGELLLPGDQDRFSELLRTARATGLPQTGEARLRGTARVPCRLHVTVSQPDGSRECSRGFAVTLTRKTGRKQAEEALRESEERLQLALLSAGAGLWDWNLVSGRIDWSPELFALFGLDPRKVSPSMESWTNVLQPDDKQIAEDRIQEAIRNKTPFSSEYRIVLPSGQVRWIKALGNTLYDAGQRPIRMLGICLDISARKQAEEALRETNTRLHLAQKSAGIGTWDWDIASQLCRPTPENQRLFGLPGHVLETTAAEYLVLIHPADVDGVTRAFQKAAQEGERYDIEYRIRRADDGEERWIRSTGRRVMMEDGRKRLTGISQDVTARRQAEESLLESENFLRKVLNASLNGISIYDVALGTSVFINQQYTVLTGYTLDDLASMTREEYFARFHPDDRARMAEHLRQVATCEEGEEREIECLLMTADGRWIRCQSRHAVFTRNPDGTARQIIGALLDITARKEAETALREREERLSIILRTAADAIITLDRRGTITSANPAATRIFGFSEMDMLGHSVNLLIPAPHHGEHDRLFERYDRDGEAPPCLTRHETLARRKDGSIFPTELSVSIVSELQSFTVVLRDVSGRNDPGRGPGAQLLPGST